MGERVLTEKEAEEMMSRSIIRGTKVFQDVWKEFKDSEEFSIEMMACGILRECAHFLTVQDWSEEDIIDFVKGGIQQKEEEGKEDLFKPWPKNTVTDI